MSAHAEGHDDHGHGGGDTTKHSSFYTTITAVIFIVFLLIAAWMIFGGEKKVIMHTVIGRGTLVSEDAEVYLPTEMSVGQYHYYTLIPGVTFKANDNPKEYYPYDFPNGEDGLTAVDDKGNSDLRYGTEFVLFTNTGTKPVTIGFGRCSTYDGCSIDFSNPALEAGTTGFITDATQSSDNPTSRILSWITFTVVTVMVFLIIVALLVKFSPKFLVKARFGVKDGHDDHDGHHGSGHHNGHDHDHATDNNGFNYGFLFVLVLSLATMFVTLRTLSVNDGTDALYALIPFMSFAFFTYLIYLGGVSVDPHVIKLILSRFSQAQVAQFHQGEGWVMPWFYILGIPDSQGGNPDVNLDKRKEKLNPSNDPEKVTFMFKGNTFIRIREFEFLVYPMDTNVDWIMRFPGAKTEDFNEMIRNEYYKAIGIVARKKSLDEALTIVKRNLPDVDKNDPDDQESFALCNEVDKIVRGALATIGVKLYVFSSMSQPLFVGKLKDAMALQSELTQVKDVIKRSFPGLNEAEVEKRARIWLDISKENFDVKGLDPNTLATITQIATAILSKKKKK